jgi:hypothetical protein
MYQGTKPACELLAQYKKITYSATKQVLCQECKGHTPQLEDWGCDNVLPDSGHHTPQ